VTNHKCGTCRFYEVGAQQTHGWCRNPAYPRRDDVALLRNDELACRSGWGKDFWEIRSAGQDAPEMISPLIDETTQPIPVPIGTGIAEHQAPTLAAASRMPAATGIPPRHAARHDGAQGATNTVSAPARSLTTAPKDGPMGTIKTTPPLNGHPELNELGVPIRSLKRSSVAEAHRRAMERRVQERQTKEERDRLTAQEAHRRADAAREHQSNVQVTESVREQRPISGDLKNFSTPTPVKAPSASTPQEERAAPKRELTRPEIAAPIMPRPREQDEPVSTATTHEAEDVIISTGETIKIPNNPAVFTPDTIAPQQGPIGDRSFDTAPEPEAVVPPAPTPANTPEPAPVAPSKDVRSAPYWHQSGALQSFGRLRPKANHTATPDRADDSQAVRRVGRQSAGDPKPTSTRVIKPLGMSLSGTPAVEEEHEVAPPVRPARSVEVKQTIVVPAPTPVEPAPRQIDESLLRQLENDWQAQQREAHTGQRCGTCRFFQSAEMGRGSCTSPFAPVYHQQTEAEGLPCATALGVWWAAPDEGWLERTERRPRRATPLLDALLREREAMEPLRTAPPLRRGAR